jgi:hypothetical protein
MMTNIDRINHSPDANEVEVEIAEITLPGNFADADLEEGGNNTTHSNDYSSWTKKWTKALPLTLYGTVLLAALITLTLRVNAAASYVDVQNNAPKCRPKANKSSKAPTKTTKASKRRNCNETTVAPTPPVTTNVTSAPTTNVTSTPVPPLGPEPGPTPVPPGPEPGPVPPPVPPTPPPTPPTPNDTWPYPYDGYGGGNVVLVLFENVRRVLSWLGMVSDDEEEVFIEVEEVVNLFELEGANVTTRMCDVPEQSDNPAVWSYYDRLIEKNRNTASLARHVEEYAPKLRLDDIVVEQEGQQEDEGDNGFGVEDEVGSFIPYRLVFTHKDNLLDCEASLSEPSLHTMAHNVYDTIKAYSEVWGDVEYDFLTDVECRKAIYEVEPELLAYYDGLEGMLKADICRSADLYLNGG